MGACTSFVITAKVTYKNGIGEFKVVSITDLRLKIIKYFDITSSFQILHNTQILKTSLDLFKVSKSSKTINLLIETMAGNHLPSKSQIRIGINYAVLYQSKYLIFPSYLFTETTIKKQKIFIKNEEFALKDFYLLLDIPGLALGKIRKQGRKPESLQINDFTSSEELFVYKDSKKMNINSLKPNKSLISLLVYNTENLPVSIIS